MHPLRSFALLMLLAIFGGALAACAPSTVTSTELNLYGFPEYIPEKLIDEFERETEITVNYATYSTNEEMLAGLQNKPGKYDLIIPSDYAVESLIERNALLPLDLSLIPNYNNIYTPFLNPYFDPGGDTTADQPALQNQKFSLPYLWGTTGILYDQTKVSQPITSWSDLWRPELAGHLVVLDDAREMMGIALLSLGYDKNATDPDRLMEAREKLMELAPGIVAFGAETIDEYLVFGEVWVAVMYNGNAAVAERSNPDLVYVFPEEGVGIWFDNMAIPADAPHADAAQAFMNYVLDAENAALLVQSLPYSTPNMGALEFLKENDSAFYEAYVSSLASSPPQDALLGAKMVKNVDIATALLYEEYWALIKSGR